MHARSALFDVYGDHLRAHGNTAPVSALVRLLEPVGIAAPAVRTAVSRMVQQGWLEPVRTEGGPGYRASAHAVRRLDDAGDRIYRRADRGWDGRWHLAIVTGPSGRPGRQRMRADLAWLGFAPLSDGVWVGPHPRSELPDVVEQAGGRLIRAVAEEVDPADAPLRAWDLEDLAGAYAEWLDWARGLGSRHGDDGDPDRCAFAVRFELVHEWRKFLFRDPGLPDRLLPPDWPGRAAAAHFTAEAERLHPGAERFLTRCLEGAADSSS